LFFVIGDGGFYGSKVSYALVVVCLVGFHSSHSLFSWLIKALACF
jgi:hypothetical protein